MVENQENSYYTILLDLLDDFDPIAGFQNNISQLLKEKHYSESDLINFHLQEISILKKSNSWVPELPIKELPIRWDIRVKFRVYKLMITKFHKNFLFQSLKLDKMDLSKDFHMISEEILKIGYFEEALFATDAGFDINKRVILNIFDNNTFSSLLKMNLKVFDFLLNKYERNKDFIMLKILYLSFNQNQNEALKLIDLNFPLNENLNELDYLIIKSILFFALRKKIELTQTLQLIASNFPFRLNINKLGNLIVNINNEKNKQITKKDNKSFSFDQLFIIQFLFKKTVLKISLEELISIRKSRGKEKNTNFKCYKCGRKFHRLPYRDNKRTNRSRYKKERRSFRRSLSFKPQCPKCGSSKVKMLSINQNLNGIF